MKKCFVPSCANTCLNSNKIFISVPKSESVRKSWCAAVNRVNIPSSRSTIYCCEDHFKMNEDFENWMEYRMMNVKLRMKKNCMPHLNSIVLENAHNVSQLSPASKKRKTDKMNLSYEDRLCRNRNFLIVLFHTQ
ncbi:uncharacterized protein LOC123317421 [Coccinella septempunctata]|uniref:uncharacterized protein LOC123317421 n=1 Tax=Coccinella septempunctata TaxID=41139 RepID=UPI001D099092|nr:uncharacterized protein LOC123317421 [Coccinella septempunctata]